MKRGSPLIADEPLILFFASLNEAAPIIASVLLISRAGVVVRAVFARSSADNSLLFLSLRSDTLSTHVLVPPFMKKLGYSIYNSTHLCPFCVFLTFFSKFNSFHCFQYSIIYYILQLYQFCMVHQI